MIVAGHNKMFGAAVLAAAAAARAGAGYVYLLTESENFPFQKHPDFILVNSAKKIENLSSVGIGPALGLTKSKAELLKKMIRLPVPLVADADALTLIAKLKLKVSANTVLTPHEAELGRLLGKSAEWVRSQRYQAISEAQKKFGCVVLLKGHRTLVASKNAVFEIRAGNPALAKAGTGDVLTGVIAGLLAQGLSPEAAACLGAFIHGEAADAWIDSRDPVSLMASDLLNLLPEVIFKIRA